MIVANAILVSIPVTTPPNNDDEDNSIRRVIKPAPLDYYNEDREKLPL